MQFSFGSRDFDLTPGCLLAGRVAVGPTSGPELYEVLARINEVLTTGPDILVLDLTDAPRSTPAGSMVSRVRTRSDAVVVVAAKHTLLIAEAVAGGATGAMGSVDPGFLAAAAKGGASVFLPPPTSSSEIDASLSAAATAGFVINRIAFDTTGASPDVIAALRERQLVRVLSIAGHVANSRPADQSAGERIGSDILALGDRPHVLITDDVRRTRRVHGTMLAVQQQADGRS